MEDRYLFRARRIDNGELVQGYFVKKHGISFVYETKECQQSNYEVDENTLCQCTGLKDKSGKLIWENDIVYIRMNGLRGYGRVVYKDGCYWVEDKKRGRWYPFSNHDIVLRVDDNVFDNPELLEV